MRKRYAIARVARRSPAPRAVPAAAIPHRGRCSTLICGNAPSRCSRDSATVSHASFSITARSISLDDLLLRLARGALPLLVEFLAEQKRLPGGRRLDLGRQRRAASRRGSTSASLQRCGSNSTRSVHSCFPSSRSSSLREELAVLAAGSREALDSLLNIVNARSGTTRRRLHQLRDDVLMPVADRAEPLEIAGAAVDDLLRELLFAHRRVDARRHRRPAAREVLRLIDRLAFAASPHRGVMA